MQVKRNPLTIHNTTITTAKSASLLQPFISISKASTPVRTRVIGSSQPNSTPINFNKMVGQMSKSPTNKQNVSSNYIKLLPGYKSPNNVDNKVNLSPILALNRKTQQNNKISIKKSFTPQVIKLAQSEQNNTDERIDKNYNTLNSINNSKGQYQTLNNTTNFTNLRGSNCFKNLIQHNRAKSPNRFQNNVPLLKKRQSAPTLKQSLNSNKFLNTLGPKLIQSKSQDRLKSFGNTLAQNYQIKCMNNDGQIAKYRVLSSQGENDNYNQEWWYYCSHCTTPLVQQGFTVQQLIRQQKQSVIDSYGSRKDREKKQKLEQKKKNIEEIYEEIGSIEQHQLNQLDKYYNLIIDYIQKQRNGDRKIIEQHYRQKKGQLYKTILQLDNVINQYDSNLMSPYKSVKGSMQNILHSSFNNLQTANKPCYNIRSNQLFNRFVNNYQQKLKINLNIQQYQYKQKQIQFQDNYSNRNHAMRFSFQRLLTDLNNKKINAPLMNQVQELDNQQDQQQNQEKNNYKQTAFRDLFPQNNDEDVQFQNGIFSPTFKKI